MKSRGRKYLIYGIVLFVIVASPLFAKTVYERNFVVAISEGNILKAQKYFTNWIDVNAVAYDGWSALTIASRNGDIKSVEWLIDNNADIDGADGSGNTALFWAAFYGREDLVKYLVLNRANIEKRCEACASPKDIAGIRGHHKIVDILNTEQKRQEELPGPVHSLIERLNIDSKPSKPEQSPIQGISQKISRSTHGLT